MQSSETVGPGIHVDFTTHLNTAHLHTTKPDEEQLKEHDKEPETCRDPASSDASELI